MPSFITLFVKYPPWISTFENLKTNLLTPSCSPWCRMCRTSCRSWSPAVCGWGRCQHHWPSYSHSPHPRLLLTHYHQLAHHRCLPPLCWSSTSTEKRSHMGGRDVHLKKPPFNMNVSLIAWLNSMKQKLHDQTCKTQFKSYRKLYKLWSYMSKSTETLVLISEFHFFRMCSLLTDV